MLNKFSTGVEIKTVIDSMSVQEKLNYISLWAFADGAWFNAGLLEHQQTFHIKFALARVSEFRYLMLDYNGNPSFEGKLCPLVPFAFCRDYFHDTVAAIKHKLDWHVYGFRYQPNPNDNEDTLVFMIEVDFGRGGFASRAYSVEQIKILHSIENDLFGPVSDIKQASRIVYSGAPGSSSPTSRYYVCRPRKEWFTFPQTVSLLTFVLRNIPLLHNYKKIDTIQKLSSRLSGLHLDDNKTFDYLKAKRNYIKIKHFCNNREEFIPLDVWKDAVDISNQDFFHNWYGILNLVKYPQGSEADGPRLKLLKQKLNEAVTTK
jgi:hypothetical protein